MAMNSTTHYFSKASWANSAAILLQEAVQQATQQRGSCDVMLTGGHSAELVYRAWAELPEFEQLRDIRFYFGDERCVPPDHPESNFGMAVSALFPIRLPDNVRVYRMEADRAERDAAADRYAALLPTAIDVLLLSIGEDGHIASLFPHCDELHETRKRVVPVTGQKPPYQRLSITPPVIQSAAEVIVLALGQRKRAMFEEALLDPANIDAIPARLVIERTWIFGE